MFQMQISELLLHFRRTAPGYLDLDDSDSPLEGSDSPRAVAVSSEEESNSSKEDSDYYDGKEETSPEEADPAVGESLGNW